MKRSKLFWKLFLTYVVLMTLAMLALTLFNYEERGKNAFSMLVVVGLLATAATYWTAKQILGPIEEITAAAQQLSRGEKMGSLSFQRDDELGTLADTLRNMDLQIRTREGQVRDTGELLSTVLEGMTEGVLAVDNGGKILFANPAARSILGVPTENVAGKLLTKITRNPVLRLAVTRAMSATPAKDTAAAREEETLEMVSETTPHRSFVLNANRLGGTPCPGVVIGFHDVSDIRQLQQMRQEFVSNVSHELKTPLSCIKAYAETLRAGAVDDARVNREFLSRIEEQSDRLNDLILDMIRLARIESGQQGFDIVSVPISEIVDVSFHRHQTAATERNVQLRCDTELPEAYVRADEEGLQQIMDNLIDNAVKYSRQNGHVDVSWKISGDDVVISVADDGLGIKPEDQKRVFERFYRVDKSRSSELASTGLGLSIVKHMARAFGGGVSLESEFARGSTFRVRLQKA
jgi:two-component system phosphate regulon sensor histidine kinase PhoR